jgi:hypothetical protein
LETNYKFFVRMKISRNSFEECFKLFLFSADFVRTF